MPTPFPGMDPYLERRSVWEEVHTDLITEIRQFLTPLLRPRYRVAIEQRTYLAVLPPDDQLVGLPDIVIKEGRSPGPLAGKPALMVAEPLIGELPTPEEVRERYLEVRDTATQEVVTVVEILSRSNKLTRAGRAEYEDKRLKILGSKTNLVEIDLLRAGKPFAMKLPAANGQVHSDYRIVVSRSWQRPRANFYLFGVREPIPTFPIPLRRGEDEPALPLNQLLHQLYDQSGYDLAVDYRQPPDPPLGDQDAQWAQALSGQQTFDP